MLARIAEADHEPFKRSELFPPGKGGFSNECGDADGSSVVRCASLTDADIREKAAAQARKRPGREQRGALVANVDHLRSIKLPEKPDEQVVFVYDDPLVSEHLHAVIRGCEALGRPDQDDLRNRIRAQFANVVAP